jgi:hypothetical protein
MTAAKEAARTKSKQKVAFRDVIRRRLDDGALPINPPRDKIYAGYGTLTPKHAVRLRPRNHVRRHRRY